MKNYFRGFTLVELLVVVSIIGILLSISFLAFEGAREKSRDEKRATDVAEYQLGMKLYMQKNRELPDYPDGVQLGVGNPIDTLLDPHMPVLPEDPQGNSGYEYWYDSAYDCGGRIVPVIYVTGMEKDSNENFDRVCQSLNLDFQSTEEKLVQKIDFSFIKIVEASSGGSDPCFDNFMSHYSSYMDPDMEARIREGNVTAEEQAFYDEYEEQVCNCDARFTSYCQSTGQGVWISPDRGPNYFTCSISQSDSNAWRASNCVAPTWPSDPDPVSPIPGVNPGDDNEASYIIILR